MASTTAHTHNVVEKSGVSAVNDRHRGSSNSSDHDLHGGKTEAEMTETPNEMYAIEAPENAADVEMDEQEKNRILRKIDIAIVPYSALLYLLSFLDRVNIGQARVAGMLPALQMSDSEYQLALTIFFVTYVAVEVPSNLALKVLTPQLWISINLILWSICTICLGVCKTPAQLIVVRALLGLFEGGLFPGLNFIFSLYYTREELGRRVAIFFAGATLAGAFGGLLAYGIRQMAGVGGLGGWSWIFILEGLLTLACGLPAYWLIQDFPARAKLFKGSERQKWLHHLNRSQGVTSAETPFRWEHVRRGLKDWHCWIYAVLYLSIATPFYCLSLFLPVIITGLGFSGPQANALSTPPYFLGFLTTLLACWYSDKIQKRGIILIGCMSVCAIGYIILIAQYTPGVSYFATFLTVGGVSPSIALAIVWVGPQFGPVTLRAAVMGVFFSFGNSAGIISSNVYPSRTSPRFFQGHGIALGFTALTIVCAIIIIIDAKRENERRDRVYGPTPARMNLLHADQAQLEKWGLVGMSREEVLDLGHNHPGHRFVL